MSESSTDARSSPPDQAARYEELLREAAKFRGVSLWQDAWVRLRRNRVAYFGLWFLLMLGGTAFLTPFLPIQSPILQSLDTRKYQAPNFVAFGLDDIPADRSSEAYDQWLRQRWHKPGRFTRLLLQTRFSVFGPWCVPSICGTDELGRDVLSRVLWGARVSLSVGVVAGIVSLVIGVSYGATAGYLGGFIDNLMMRIVDVLYSVPFIYVVIFLMTFLSKESVAAFIEREFFVDRLMALYLIIGAIYWLTMARVVRGQIISLKNEQFVEAAQVIGAGKTRIIFRHLIPNVMAIVIVYLTLTIPSIMLFESFLSFVGLGVPPPDVSWGQLVDGGIQVITPIRIYWWLVLFPGLTMTMTLFALNFLGDGLRDSLDPRMKNRS